MKKILKITFSLILIFLIVLDFSSPLTSFALSIDEKYLDDGLIVTSKSNYNISPGVRETDFTLNNKRGDGQVKAYAVEVDLSDPNNTVIASNMDCSGEKWGMQSVRDQGYGAERKLGVNVVAGINGDFFNMKTGEPWGSLIMNGVQYKARFDHGYFAVLNDGTPIIRMPADEDYVSKFYKAKELINGFSVIVRNGVINTEPAVSGDLTVMPRSAVGITEDNKVVFYSADGRQPPSSAGQTLPEVAKTMMALGCKDVLQLDGGGSTTLLSKREGESDLTCRNTPSDGVERKVSTSLLICSNVKPTGAFDHASITPSSGIYTPYTKINFTASGVDSGGFEAPLPEDGKFSLADDTFGTITSDGVFVSSGKEGSVGVIYKSGEKESKVTVKIRIPDTLKVAQKEVSLSPLESTDFGLKALFNSKSVNLKDGDIEWRVFDESGVRNDVGRFDGLNFTVNENVKANVTIRGALKYNKDLFFEIKAVIGAEPVTLFDFENYTTNKGLLNENESLKYIPAYDLPVWDNESALSNKEQRDNFYKDNYPLYTSQDVFEESANPLKASIVSKKDGYPVRFGESSLKIDYNYDGYKGKDGANFYLCTTAPTYSFEGNPTALGAWVYIPEGTPNYSLFLCCSTKNYKMSYSLVSGDTGISGNGWKYFQFNLKNSDKNAPFGLYQGCPVFWISYQPSYERGADAKGSIYLDDVKLIYGANKDDTENPVIREILSPGAVISPSGDTVFDKNILTLQALVEEGSNIYNEGVDPKSAKIYLDGADMSGSENFYYEEHDGELYLYDEYIKDGVHSITASVSDNFGNYSEETRYFTVSGGDRSSSVELVSSGAPTLGEKYCLNLTSEDTENILSADACIKIISNFTSYWENLKVRAGINYELSGEPCFNKTDKTISLKVNRKDGDLPPDDIIAKIEIDVPTNAPEGLNVTFRVTKGTLTLKSSDKDNFVPTFSGKITAAPQSRLKVYADAMLVGGKGGYIHVTDTDGNPVNGANIYTKENKFLGKTDNDGKFFTDKFVKSAAEYSVYAQKDGRTSFVFSGQSFPSGGSPDGLPNFIKLNATSDFDFTQSISWISSPVNSDPSAQVLYAEKGEYSLKGDLSFKKTLGESVISEMTGGDDINANYAVRINHVTLDDLKPDTEYVFKAGDGKKTSELKSFSTAKAAKRTDFFVLGDVASTDIGNLSNVANALKSSGKEYAFGIETGDIINNDDKYASFSNIAGALSGEFLGSVGLIHVLGENEYKKDGAADAGEYFGLSNSSNIPACYSLVYNNIYIAVINYGESDDYKTASEWIKNDVKRSKAQWRVLAVHTKPYFGGADSGEAQKTITKLSDDAGFDFVFSGCDHAYIRTIPLKNKRYDNNGTVYYVTGSLGTRTNKVKNGGSPYFESINTKYNVLYFTASATDMEFTVNAYNLSSDGLNPRLIDSFTKTKEVSCAKNGHNFKLKDGLVSCGVCGYKIPLKDFTGFIMDGGSGKKKYFLEGKATTGWLSLSKDYYYFDKNGDAVSGSVKIDGKTYVFDDSGKLIKGALIKENSRYYYYIAGQKQRGWRYFDGRWHYFDRTTDFRMVTGKFAIENGDEKMLFTFNDNGELIIGAWQTNENGKSYFWADNERATGTQYIDGSVYHFDDKGFMQTGKNNIDGEEYTFSKNGKLNLKNGSIKAFDCVYGKEFYYSFDDNGKIYLNHITDHPYSKVIDEAKPPTYDGDGYTAGEHCAVCGQVFKQREAIPRLEIETTAAPETTTVTENGGTTAPNTSATTENGETAATTEFFETTAPQNNETASPQNNETTATEPRETTANNEKPAENTTTGANILPGDIDNDGKVEASDARMVLRISARLIRPPEGDILSVADMDGDGRITSEDARLVLIIAAKSTLN